MAIPLYIPHLPHLVAGFLFWGSLFLLLIISVFHGKDWWESRTSHTVGERIPASTLLKKAHENGWNFIGGGVEIIQFTDMLRQAALDKKIEFFGRRKAPSSEDTKRMPLDAIAAEHWKSHHIDWRASVDWDRKGNIATLESNNLTIATVTDSGERSSYRDLYVNQNSLKWLKNNVKKT